MCPLVLTHGTAAMCPTIWLELRLNAKVPSRIVPGMALPATAGATWPRQLNLVHSLQDRDGFGQRQLQNVQNKETAQGDL